MNEKPSRKGKVGQSLDERAGLSVAATEMSFSGPHMGKILGDGYRITRLLGRGAEGHIYIAQHGSMPERTFVAKVGLMPLKSLEYIDGIPADPILREAYILSHIVGGYFPVFFQSGLTRNGYSFLIREHIVGKTLSELVGRNNPLPLRLVIGVGAALCEAVATLHRYRYVHGDVKPQNIVLADLEKPESLRLVDFGASGPLHQTPRLILSDADTEGTPAYMAPERTDGVRGATSADLYSVASVVYELLAGTPTLGDFSYDPREAKAYLRSNKPIPCTPLSVKRPELPQELLRTVERGLDRDPQRRGDWVLGFREALMACQSSVQVSKAADNVNLSTSEDLSTGKLHRWVRRVSRLWRS
ncbi:MAG: serine/threonine protein kinase [Myxococcales bacterium]|nr:serine/threonine protein kinase [Myxococcales bacterium]